MNESRFRQLTGALLILVPIAFSLCFTLLQTNFEYPDILRAPTDQILRRFHAGGSGLVATWYGFLLSAITLLPVAIMLHKALARDDTPYLGVATMFGIVAGVVQVLGLIRWPFLVPYLSQVYVDPASSPATREAATVVFQAFHRYAGVAIGEHLGYLFTSVWAALIGLAMLKSPLFRPWLGWMGIIAAACIFVGIFEPLGLAAAGAINAISYLAFAIWLVVIGVFTLRARPSTDKHLGQQGYTAARTRT